MPPASTVPSPCVGVCRMHPLSGWCEGCLRTLDEIGAWSTMTDLQKRAVWKQLPGRREQAIVLHGVPPEARSTS